MQNRDRDLPSVGSVPTGQLPELGQHEARSLELNLGPLHGWQRPNCLGYHMQPPRVCIICKLDGKQSWKSNLGTLIGM